MFWMAFVVVACVMSLFYGIYAVTIWFRATDLSNAQTEIRGRDAWLQGPKDIFRHPQYFHQVWFNFAGSALGWTALGYVIWRLSRQPDKFGFAEASLLMVGAIGISGYLPAMLHRIVGTIDSVVGAIKKL